MLVLLVVLVHHDNGERASGDGRVLGCAAVIHEGRAVDVRDIIDAREGVCHGREVAVARRVEGRGKARVGGNGVRCKMMMRAQLPVLGALGDRHGTRELQIVPMALDRWGRRTEIAVRRSRHSQIPAVV